MFDAELHLVHRSETGALAVVAVFLQAGDADDALRPFFDALPLGVHGLVSVPDPHPLGIRVADLARLREAIHGENRRPAQPANGRAIALRSL